jgi:hypothetical protein
VRDREKEKERERVRKVKERGNTGRGERIEIIKVEKEICGQSKIKRIE